MKTEKTTIVPDRICHVGNPWAGCRACRVRVRQETGEARRVRAEEVAEHEGLVDGKHERHHTDREPQRQQRLLRQRWSQNDHMLLRGDGTLCASSSRVAQCERREAGTRSHRLHSRQPAAKVVDPRVLHCGRMLLHSRAVQRPWIVRRRRREAAAVADGDDGHRHETTTAMTTTTPTKSDAQSRSRWRGRGFGRC